MKKLRANLDSYFQKLDKRWQALPLRKQHRYTLYFFAGYLLLTTGVVCKVWHDTLRSENEMVIAPTDNLTLKKNEIPARLQDTPTILKTKIYERK